MHHLDQGSINLLSSQQVITSVFDAVKELIENSLDAGAKTIKILMEDIGLRKIEVTDDGSGITPNGRDDVALPHTTSKISTIEDLNNELSTFGFRGEAIHSICCLGDVSITTRCKGEDSALTMVFNHDGTIKSRKKSTANVGTTVCVQNLLDGLPVRIRDERAKFNPEILKGLLSRYYLSAPQVRFIVDCPPHFTVTRPPLTNLQQAVSLEFGVNVSSQLSSRNSETFIGDVRVKLQALVPDQKSDWKTVSTNRNSARQILIVNGRPVRSAAVEKVINENFWKVFGTIPKRFPRFVICLDFFRDQNITSSLIDVNRDAAKYGIAFSEEQSILKFIEKSLSLDTNHEKEVSQKTSTISKWPSKSPSISLEDESTQYNIEKFGTYKWKHINSFDEFPLFFVEGQSDKHILAVKTEGLFEQCGVATPEIARIPPEELIVMYWDKIIEFDKVSKKVVHVAEIVDDKQ
ncbi:ATPase, putative [Trichomonas vaginalis G3]|uniref:ATPase, putative n=3 Tax=Trichomonas vaginalis TaxID=5722 RepID=A2EBG6_TRIV3|nr:DNA mismatch repair protein, MLH2-like [Trichomonas vaginalis G3]ABC61975.1 MLH2-like protein 1 [Trichomonas vaginalis]AEW27276.1 MLH2A [Trichomonas vaginalis]EAY09996.1 ATPase, putative [Trichomonas vaginalis G3]KAI5535076.1 DNA mismatch repair protein, MLH2-like [Trichomonas vaginalis G3]|eukprot:XP_001322219.1 ATPase [Trichomonas vaginalis G3]